MKAYSKLITVLLLLILIACKPTNNGDLAEGERPSVRVLSTDSARFRTLVERTRAARGADFSACDIELPVEVD